MKVTELRGSSAYHVHLNLALADAVEEYKTLSYEIQKHPPLSEETATAELTRLYYLHEEKCITVILLAAACVEAVVNFYLATKTTPEQFAVLERATFIDKWVVLPSLFLKDYTFPKGSVLYQDLKLLHNRRNSLLHLKATITEGGKIVHKGTELTVPSDEKVFIERCASLPDRLVRHITSFDPTGVQDLVITLSITWRKHEEKSS